MTNACDGHLHAVVLCSVIDPLKSLNHQRYQEQRSQVRHSAKHAPISEELKLYIMVAVCARLQMIVVVIGSDESRCHVAPRWSVEKQVCTATRFARRMKAGVREAPLEPTRSLTPLSGHTTNTHSNLFTISVERATITTG